MQFRVLGPVEAHHDGRPIDLGPVRQRHVLAALLIDANRVVTAGELAERVWGENPPARAVPTLRTYLSRLRSTMLVLLDNARDTNQVVPLLPGGPTCTVVVTSRQQLTGLLTTHAARPVALDLLPDVEARDLLARRLGHARLDREPDAAADLRLDLGLAGYKKDGVMGYVPEG